MKIVEENIRKHVSFLADPALKGRQPSTVGSTKALNYIVNELTRYGYSPIVEDYKIDLTREGKQKFAANVYCKILPDRVHAPKFIVVGAHYDHISGSPGADDNAVSVAQVLEVARQCREIKLQGYGIYFCFWDCEEPPYFHTKHMGSTTWLERHGVDRNIDAAIVLDLTGHVPTYPIKNPQRKIFVTGAETAVGLLDAVIKDNSGLSAVPLDNKYVGNMSDHHAFEEKKYPFLFLSAGRGKHYHQPTDTIENVDYEYAKRVYDYLMFLVIELVTTRKIDALPVNKDTFKEISAGRLQECLPLLKVNKRTLDEILSSMSYGASTGGIIKLVLKNWFGGFRRFR